MGKSDDEFLVRVTLTSVRNRVKRERDAKAKEKLLYRVKQRRSFTRERKKERTTIELQRVERLNCPAVSVYVVLHSTEAFVPPTKHARSLRTLISAPTNRRRHLYRDDAAAFNRPKGLEAPRASEGDPETASPTGPAPVSPTFIRVPARDVLRGPD